MLHWGAPVEASGLTAAHVAAYLLEDEAISSLALAAPPSLLHAADVQGRTPLHYAAHGSERLHGLVYLFSPQAQRP